MAGDQTGLTGVGVGPRTDIDSNGQSRSAEREKVVDPSREYQGARSERPRAVLVVKWM